MSIKIQNSTVINDDKSFVVGSGTTTNRPSAPATGTLWYNTDLNVYERYDGTNWKVTGNQANKADAQFLYANNATYETFRTFYDGGIALQSAYPDLYAKFGLTYDQFGTSWNVIGSTLRVVSGITYGANGYVIVGAVTTTDGQIRNSTNGINWTSSTSGTTTFLSAITFGGGLYVYGGSGGALGTSTNGSNWTARTSGTTTGILALAFGDIGGNNLYIRGGWAGAIGSSTNAINWTARTSGTTTIIQALTFGNSIFVRGGQGGTIGSSTNGLNWTARTSGTTTHLTALTFGNGLYVYGALGGILGTSTDAINWTLRTSGNTRDIESLTYAENLYVAGTVNGAPVNSTNGINWSPLSGDIPNSGYVAHDGSNFTFVSDSGALSTSTDGISGEIVGLTTTSGSSQIPTTLAYANNLFLVGGGSGFYSTSTNGINWTTGSIGVTRDINGFDYGNGVYAYAASSGGLGYSTNAINWTTSTAGISNPFRGIVFANGIFVVAGPSIYTSTNAINWTLRDDKTTSIIMAVSYANGLYFYGDDGNNIGVSTDGINWERIASTATLEVTYSNGLYIASGDNQETIRTSTNGRNWQTGTGVISAGNPAYGFTVGPDAVYFVGRGTNGVGLNVIRKTTNGVNYSNTSISTSSSVMDIIFPTPNTAYFLGWAGEIGYSDSSYSYNTSTEFKLPDNNKDTHPNIPKILNRTISYEDEIRQKL